MFAFLVIPHDGTGIWNLFLWKSKTHLSYIHNTMATDDLVIHRSGASDTLLSTWLCHNIMAPTAEGLTLDMLPNHIFAVIL